MTATVAPNTVVTQAHHEALSKAKIRLMARPDSAFFTTLCFSLKHIWDSSIRTAATNGKNIKYNPDFFMSLTPDEHVFLMLHESMHVAYLHMLRLGTRDPRRWNIAADYVINHQLVERGFRMPKVGLHNPQYAGMSTEQVYDALPTNPPDDYMDDLEDPGEGDGDSEAITSQLTQEVQDILIRAAIQSKMAGDKPGTIPGDVQVTLDKLLNPKLPWNKILQKYLNSFAKNDYSFKKPNRRFFPQHYMPSLYGTKLMNLAIAVDISGSVSDHDFTTFISETASILRMMQPDEITVLQFDTKIHHEDKVKNLRELEKLTFTGRGGTCVQCVLEWVKTKKPQLLVVFTDGGFTLPTQKPKNTEVLWLIHNNPKWVAPFGKAIHYTI